jgi:hypothetical protein
LFSL